MSDTSPEIDWQALAELAKRDPIAFERHRSALLNDMLARVSHERRGRLEAYQSHLDRLRERAKNPLHACVLFEAEMRTQLEKLQRTCRGEITPASVVSLRARD
ncbi:DUF3135 domain-containing protein [Paraferrimonas sedimenticola]|uniref:DUF3135 domain-containing protein n=1 Tax=Paraferrimonas sedimenticola TaxID=375674 RepID=A0AA37VSK8_9GAMM|nr:DUF3135 domain-containing protein [Paraferrimonas sedimenticola]GLP94721.1 hypothetical protein GCM10007895_00270 [Paraferrimonas sedimenticola]